MEQPATHGRIYALAVAVAATAVALSAWKLTDLVPPVPGAIPWLAIAVAFAVAETFPVHLQHRREAISLSLSTIPLVVGLFTLTPLMLIAARVVGTAAVLVVHRRQRPYKLALNISLFSLDAAVAALVFHALLPAGAVTVRSWPASFLAALCSDLVATVVLVLAIGLHQRKLESGVVGSALIGTGVAFVDTCAALLVVTLVIAEPAGLLLLGLVFAPLVGSYRLYSSLREQHRTLEQLHELTSSMGASADEDAVLANLIERAQDVMRADAAWVRLPGEAGGDVPGPILLPDATCMAAPLVGPDGPLGALYVGERSGDVRAFASDDLRLLETLANHASVSLGNTRLVAQLREQASISTHQSLHDSLTGLPNRVMFNREVTDRLERPGIAAVLLLDLDRFKEVNDTLGHPNGDLLLCEAGVRLRSALRQGDVVARLGGDEFAVLLPDVAGEAAALQVAHGLVRVLEQRFSIADVTVGVGVSIGVALSPQHGGDASKLLQCADVAMYTAKADQTRVELYDPARDDHTTSSLGLVSDLREAIDSGAIEVHFQPQIDLASGRVLGAEALARWQHRTRGWVPPDEFVASAERAGLIRPLTQLVLERSLAQCAAWRAAGHELRISVNLSARSLMQASLPSDLTGLLHASGVPATSLCLELTETSMMVEPKRAVEALHRLRNMGITIAIDDFGTGHSSLAYLRELPVGEIKIDKSFVLGMREDRFDEAIVCSIVDLARHLLVPVVAEGIEDTLTADRLRAAGCSFGQGYAFQRAVPADEFDEWLIGRETGTPRLHAI